MINSSPNAALAAVIADPFTVGFAACVLALGFAFVRFVRRVGPRFWIERTPAADGSTFTGLHVEAQSEGRERDWKFALVLYSRKRPKP